MSSYGSVVLCHNWIHGYTLFYKTSDDSEIVVLEVQRPLTPSHGILNSIEHRAPLRLGRIYVCVIRLGERVLDTPVCCEDDGCARQDWPERAICLDKGGSRETNAFQYPVHLLLVQRDHFRHSGKKLT
jgi:hypothetical protein